MSSQRFKVFTGLTGLAISVLILESAVNIIRYPQNFLPDEQVWFGESEVAVTYYFMKSTLIITHLILAILRQTVVAWSRYHVALCVVLGLAVVQIVYSLTLH